MTEATIAPVVPVSEPKAPVVEESEYAKLIKTVDQDKLRGTLIALKYLAQNESFDKVSIPRQAGIVKQWDKFKTKVDAYVAFGTEVK